MSDKGERKPGPHRARSRPTHGGRAKRSSSKEAPAKRGSTTTSGGRRSRHRKSSIPRHGSSGPTKPGHDAATKSDTHNKKGSRRDSAIKDILRRTSAGRMSAGGGSKSLTGIPQAVDRQAEDFSSRERRQLRARFGKMAIVVCIAVVAVTLFVTFASMVLILGAPKELYEPSLMRGYSLTAMLRGACDTDDCRMAVGALNSSIDASANPCEDVYQYACGHWHMLGDDGKPLSYEDQLKHNYVTAVHANITGTATTDSLCRSSEPRAKIGCVYCSCVEFYTNRSSSLEHLWTAAKIDHHEWMKIDDSEVLFYLVVRTILQTNVPSVLNITRRDSTTAIIEIGRCISCSSIDDDFLKFLLDQAVSLKVVDSQVAKRIQTDFEQLDEELMSIPSTPRGANVVDGDNSMFDIVPQVVWQKALAASHAGFSSRHSDLQVLSSNSAGVGKVVAALNIVTLEIAKLYTLLAPVAPFMAVAHFETQKRTSMTLFQARSMCLENVEYLFTIPFETAVASFLGTEKAAVAFNNLWSNVRLAGVNALQLGAGLELDKNALMAASVGVEEASGLNDPSFVEDYDDDFLSNLVRYKRKGRRDIRASEFRSDAPGKSGFLPTAYFVPDYYYAGATEMTLNSGTLGALTAAMMFRRSFPKLASEPTSYVNCFVDYARQSVKLDVDRADWLTNTRVRWVAEVALMATREGADNRRRKELEALYYLRFARTYCGEKEANRKPLLFALHSSPHFNETFECSYSYPPMTC